MQKTPEQDITKLNFSASDLYNLSQEEIAAIQNRYDRHNKQTINTALKEDRISENEKEYLLRFYDDGMESYRNLYRTIYELFGQPENTCAFNQTTGSVDTDERGLDIDYSLKVLTPFVETRLEYRDKNNNPIYVVFPKMKSAKRAIEKLEKEYGRERAQAMKKYLDRFFEDDDREALRENMQNIPQTIENLHDILRLTITCKYLSDVKRLMRKITENKNPFFSINPKETRNLFDKPLAENKKKYYDIKMVMHLNDTFDAEIQLKIHTLFQGDLRTHPIYEEVRKLEAETSSCTDITSRQKQARIQILNERITRINQNAIHQYNMTVLDKARRIEYDGYRPLRIEPEYPDGTYKRCRNFISEEYLPESSDQFCPDIAFNQQDSVNKLCFLRMTKKLPSDFDEFSDQAAQQIDQKFENLSPEEKNRFTGITKIAQRYAPTIRHVIENKLHNKIMLDNQSYGR